MTTLSIQVKLTEGNVSLGWNPILLLGPPPMGADFPPPKIHPETQLTKKGLSQELQTQLCLPQL